MHKGISHRLFFFRSSSISPRTSQFDSFHLGTARVSSLCCRRYLATTPLGPVAPGFRRCIADRRTGTRAKKNFHPQLALLLPSDIDLVAMPTSIREDPRGGPLEDIYTRGAHHASAPRGRTRALSKAKSTNTTRVSMGTQHASNNPIGGSLPRGQHGQTRENSLSFSLTL